MPRLLARGGVVPLLDFQVDLGFVSKVLDMEFANRLGTAQFKRDGVILEFTEAGLGFVDELVRQRLAHVCRKLLGTVGIRDIGEEAIGVLIVEPLLQALGCDVVGKGVEGGRHRKLFGLIVDGHFQNCILVFERVKDQRVAGATKANADFQSLDVFGFCVQFLWSGRLGLGMGDDGQGRERDNQTENSRVEMVHRSTCRQELAVK